MDRKSKQKEAILRVLKGTNSHPTAEWVYEKVRQEIPKISLGTVYRNLRLLNRLGEVSELAGNVSRFESKTQNHYHFQCELCGNIYDVDEPVDRAIDDRVAQKTGFEVTHHNMEFRGRCQNCI